MQGKGRSPVPHFIPTSEDLLETYCRTRSPGDFERIVRRFAPLVFSECRRVTRNPHDAEDASQLTFLALAMELKLGKKILRPSGWLQRVAKHQAIKIVRSRGRRQKRENAVRKVDFLLDDKLSLDAAQNSGVIRDEVDHLPDRYRLPLVLHYFGGMSMEMIARELQIGKQTVGTRLHRARKMLGKKLNSHGIELNATLLSNALGLLVPAAVVSSILRMTASPAPTQASISIPAAITHLLHATALSSTHRTLKAAILAAAITAAGTAVANRLFPTIFHLPQIRLINAFDWLQRVLPAVPRASTVSAEFSPPKPIATMPDRVDFTLPGVALTTSWAQQESPLLAPQQPVVTLSAPLNLSAPAQPHSNGIDRPWKNLPVSESQTQASSAASLGTPTSSTSSTISRDSAKQAPPSVIISSGSFEAAELRLGAGAGAPRSFIQTGGTASIGHLVVGESGLGKYDLRKGQLNAGNVVIGAQSGSVGELHIGEGTLQLNDANGSVTVGAQGIGKLYVGTQDAPGTLSAISNIHAPLMIRATSDAHGMVRGWGSIGTGGTLTNNGRVVADGFDHQRTLDLSNFSSVDNTIDNPPGGNNGWFVQRGGRLRLPDIHVQQGDGVYAWGESNDDATPDLINSFRMSVQGQPTSTDVTVYLRTVALADSVDVRLPGGVSIIGLWQAVSTTFSPRKVDLTIRYNDSKASAMSPDNSILQLLAFQNGWQVADGIAIDSGNGLLSGSIEGAFSYFAVVIPWDASFAYRTTTTSTASIVTALPVPEPAMAACAGFAALLLTRRRKTSTTVARAGT